MNITSKEVYTAIWLSENSTSSKACAYLRSLLPSKVVKSTSGIHKVAIIVGHNNIAQGAYVKGNIQQSEYKFNGIVADLMVDLVKEDNAIEIKVFRRKYLGKRQYSAEIKEVYKRVNKWNPEVAMELHFNSLGGACRVEMLYYKGSVNSKHLATIALHHSSMLLHQGINTKLLPRTKNDNGGGSLYYCKSPIVLTEPFDSTCIRHVKLMEQLGHEQLAMTNIIIIREYLNI